MCPYEHHSVLLKVRSYFLKSFLRIRPPTPLLGGKQNYKPSINATHVTHPGVSNGMLMTILKYWMDCRSLWKIDMSTKLDRINENRLLIYKFTLPYPLSSKIFFKFFQIFFLVFRGFTSVYILIRPQFGYYLSVCVLNWYKTVFLRYRGTEKI